MVPKGWQLVELDSLALIERGKFSARPRNDPQFFGGDMPFVQTGDITKSSTYLTTYNQTLNQKGIGVSKVFPSNTILITIAANIGDTAITKFDVACPDSLVAIQPYKGKADTFWLKTVLDTHKAELDGQATQNAQKNINLQVLKPLLILTPPLPEQRKIAQILSTWDKAITTTERLLINRQQQKKALMQRLLTGKQRFAGFEGAWVTVSLSEVASSKKYSFTGGPFGSDLKNEDYTESGIRIIQLQNIGDGYFNNTYKIYTSIEKADQLNSCNIYPGDIIISKMGDPVARATIIPDLESRYLMSSDGIRLSVNSDIYVSTLIKEIVNSDIFRTIAISKSTGSTRKRIGLSELKNIPISLPPTIDEQQKIASVLSAADAEITTIQNQLNNLKQQKKALMQQLLTGKRRVKVDSPALATQ